MINKKSKLYKTRTADLLLIKRARRYKAMSMNEAWRLINKSLNDFVKDLI